LLLFLLALVIAGCGGGGDGPTASESSTRAQAPGDAGAGGTTAAAAAGSASPAGGKEQEKRSSSGSASRQSGSGPAPSGEEASGDGTTAAGKATGHSAGTQGGIGKTTVQVHSHAGRCPSGFSREQCEALVASSAPTAPSHTLETPEDCLQVMSKNACEELFAAEKNAQAAAGASISLEQCLADRSRAQCEAQLQALLESQYRSANGD
jgi:hypothetical protein